MSAFYFDTKIPPQYEGIRQHAKEMTLEEGTVVVHDLYHRSPNSRVSFWDRYRENKWLKKSIRSGAPVLVFSEPTQQELQALFPEAANRITVTPHKPDPEYLPNNEDARDVVRYQFTQGDAYFLYRGPLHPAAELVNLLKGFSVFKKKIGSNMKLVLSGPGGAYAADFLASLETYKFRSDVVIPGPVTPYEQVSLLASAYALVHPCRWERFGMPLPNAMKAGVAVLTVEDSAMSACCGMAGMYFNPLDPADIGEKLIRIYKDEQMRSEMIGTGLLRY
jgi:glycosyltransferase involved in cell wall biosynthesis